ncbi:MAG: FIST C-terminal domain-containing protein [Bacteroidota bacterium]
MFVTDTRIENLLSYLEQDYSSTEEGFLLLLSEKSIPDMELLLFTLKERGIKVCGGIFPALLHKGKRVDKGAIIQRFPLLGDPFVVQTQMNSSSPLKSYHNVTGKKTALVWADGLSGYTPQNLKWLYAQLGGPITYLGGGAGFMSFQQAPCVFTQDGIYQDAIVGMVLKKTARVGVSHGWKKIMGPLVATKTRKNIIYELNWEPALEVYKRSIELAGGGVFDGGNFFDLAKQYPFGIYRSQTEQLVRDPLGIGEEGAIICAGEVPENAVLNILKGEDEELIQAARQAAAGCQTSEQPLDKVLIVDCISRALFLDEKFERELWEVEDCFSKENMEVALEGVLSIGEISSLSGQNLDFYNKTIVVGAFYD